MVGLWTIQDLDIPGFMAQWWWVVFLVAVPILAITSRVVNAAGQNYGITAFVGLNGHGKTLLMTELMATQAFAMGVRVVANFRLYPEVLGKDPALFIPLQGWRNITKCGVHMVSLDGTKALEWEPQYLAPWVSLIESGSFAEVPRLNEDGTLYSITNNERCVLLLDEINAVLPSRGYSSVPPELLRIINQLRKHDVVVGWTAPAWERADKALREVTQCVWLCRAYVQDTWEREPGQKMFPKRARDENGKPIRWQTGWPPRRLFRFNVYDAADFEEFSIDATNQRRIKARGSMWYWRSKHIAQTVYGSAEGVMLLDHIDSFTGTCATCDGSRSRHKCNCKPGAPSAAAASTPEAQLQAMARERVLALIEGAQ